MLDSQQDRQKELEKRLEAMQNNARSWNQEREERVKKDIEEENQKVEKDELERSKRSDLNRNYIVKCIVELQPVKLSKETRLIPQEYANLIKDPIY